MRRSSLWIVASCGAFAGAVLAFAQAHQKPGLYEVTTVMTWQHSPFPEGMPGMPNLASAMGGPHTMQVCVTQEQIEKYGGPLPQSRNNECQASNVKRSANGMTADWVCNGNMKGKGTIESNWTDENHSTSKVHFTGTMQMGPEAKPVEWTNESTSTFKGADCGSVKPAPLSKE